MVERQKHVLLHPVILTFKNPQGEERTETVTELVMPAVGYRLKAKDLRCTDGHDGDVAKAIALVAQLAGQPVRVIDELDSEDFEAVAEIVEGFRRGRPTGETA